MQINISNKSYTYQKNDHDGLCVETIWASSRKGNEVELTASRITKTGENTGAWDVVTLPYAVKGGMFGRLVGESIEEVAKSLSLLDGLLQETLGMMESVSGFVRIKTLSKKTSHVTAYVDCESTLRVYMAEVESSAKTRASRSFKDLLQYIEKKGFFVSRMCRELGWIKLEFPKTYRMLCKELI